MTLQGFNSKYLYQSDRDKFNATDVWEVIKPNESGIYIGDCESYCLTLRKLIPEFKDYDLYYCKINGNGHCILYSNAMVIDCNIKRVVPLIEYCKYYNVTELTPYSKFVIYSKLIYTAWIKLYKKLNDWSGE